MCLFVSLELKLVTVLVLAMVSKIYQPVSDHTVKHQVLGTAVLIPRVGRVSYWNKHLPVMGLSMFKMVCFNMFCQVCIRILLHLLLSMPFTAAVLPSVAGRMCHSWLRVATPLEKAPQPFAGFGLVGTSWALHRNLHIGSGAANSATGWLRCLHELARSRPLLDYVLAAYGPVQAISVLCAWPWAGLTAFVLQALCRPHCVVPRSWAGLEVLGLWPWAGRTAASCPGLVLALGALFDQDRAQHFEFDSLVIDFLCLAWIATIASAFDDVRWNWICEHSWLGCYNHQGLLHPLVQWRSFRL